MNGRVTPGISVAVATLDRPDGLAHCLDALLRGTEIPNEIIVVDQGRETAEWVVTERRGPGIALRYIRDEGRGLSRSRNIAIDHASSPVIAVTDDDCVPSPQWVGAIDDAFAAVPDLAAVTGPVLPLGPDAPGLYAVSSRVSAVRTEYRGHALPWLVGTGANFAVKRDWLDRVGGYDERLGAGSPGGGGEDLEIVHRLLMAGGAIRYEPDALVYHERQSKERRVATRVSYGRGMGAFCGLWLRRRNLYALVLLWHWTRDRFLAGLRAIRSLDWDALREEALLLRGMAAGVAYGFTLPPADGRSASTPRGLVR